MSRLCRTGEACSFCFLSALDWPCMLLSVQPVSACVFFTIYWRRAGFLLALLYQGKEVCICALKIVPYGSYITNWEGEMPFERILQKCFLSPSERLSIRDLVENPHSKKWRMLVSFKDYGGHEKKLEIPLSWFHEEKFSSFKALLLDGGYSY